MEEILEFKEVLEDIGELLVATQFRSRAVTWLKQLKRTRERQGKKNIVILEKLKKHMHEAFLPYSYICG